MLKRARAPSPIPDIPFVQPQAVLDLPERLTKRRRHVGPATRDEPTGGEPSDAQLDDYETWLEDEGRPEYMRGQSSWQEQAGLYKTVNTLLHDLHSEQRHRALFSPQMSLPTTPFAQLDLSSPSDGEPSSWRVGRPKSPSFLNQSLVIPAPRHPPSKVFPDGQQQPSVEGLQFLDNSETDMVAHRYQDANRLLGSLFLSRRRMLDPQEQAQDRT